MAPKILSDSQATPFKIEISDEQLKQLQEKLKASRLPDELIGAGDDYGAPLADLQRLLARWKDGYDWRKYEKQLNEELPQFQQDIGVEGFGKLKIHYIHKRSEVRDAIPLLFLHGCMFLQLDLLLPALTK